VCKTDSHESWGIVLVLVVVLVLDMLFWHQGGHDPPAIVLFHRYDGRISRILEQEHEHELSTSVFGFKDLRAILATGPTEAASEHLCSVLHLGQLSLYARGN